MIQKNEVQKKINDLLYERLFSAIRKIIIEKQKTMLMNSTEYKDANTTQRKDLLRKYYKTWYNSISNFFLTYNSIKALYPLVERELKIREFSSAEVIRIKADYIVNDIEFSAYYPTHYNPSMQKEVEDCIAELKSSKYPHIVDSYIPKKDTERTPHEPLTTAELKYSSFYLFGFEPEYVSTLAQILYQANLITNPETNGWEIDSSVAEDMITILNKKYGEDKVLQYKRPFVDRVVNRTEQECIRPTNISTRYFPKAIESTPEFNSIDFVDNHERTDILELYKFIYYITLSTQLKNSIYDTSVIEIVIGNKTLKEQAHHLIEGNENWELLSGKVITNISKSDDSNGSKTVVLPEVNPNSELKPLDVYAYSYHSKRPPRYGIGRFVTQILEKNAIGSNGEHDELINNLLGSKSVLKIKTMLHPQENSIVLIQWLREHLPSLLDNEYLRELEEKIQLVTTHELTLDSILEEINRLIDEAFDSAGYIEDESKPSQAKLNLLNSIAKKHNLYIDEDTRNSNIKIDLILAQYPSAEPMKVGSCPKCNSLVYQKEFNNGNTGEVVAYYSCEKYGKDEHSCNFTIWDNYLHKYFSDKGIELFSIEERTSVLKKILSKKKGYLFNDFVAANKKSYDAKIYLKPYTDKNTHQKKWGFGMKFMNDNKKQG